MIPGTEHPSHTGDVATPNRQQPFSADAVVKSLQSIVPGPAPLHEPEFQGNEWAYVKECLDTGWVSSVGAFVDRFERDLCTFVGVEHAVATVNGTAAMHVSLELAGVTADDEVLMPALTFVATANAVKYCGANPHFVDSDAKTFGVDPEKLAGYLSDIAAVDDGRCVNRITGRRIAALVCVHVFGHPADTDALAEVCARYGIPLVEDAAESLGSTYKDRQSGGLGVIGALSFNGNKILTTGGGGAILTNDPNLAKRARHLTTTAKVTHRWDFVHDAVGYNYRMPNLNAALGCAQLETLSKFVDNKRSLARKYQEVFENFEGVSVFVEQPWARSNYWLNALILDSEHTGARDDILELGNAAGYGLRPCWTPMHALEMYSGCPRAPLDTTEKLVRSIINLPSSPSLAA